MKRTIFLVLVLALCMIAEVANADFSFVEPMNIGTAIQSSSDSTSKNVLGDGLTFYFDSKSANWYSQVLSEGKIPLTVASVCMNAKVDKWTNIETFTKYIREASEKEAKLIVFPEIALQQNPGWGDSAYQPTEEELRYMLESAETIPGPSTEALVEIASQHNICVIFGMTEKSLDGELYNASVFLGPNGILGKYRKRRLYDSSIGGNEHLLYKRGNEGGLVSSPLGKVGLVICAEMAFGYGPNLAREGADFLATVAAWPDGSLYERFTKSNAAEAGRWHIVANQTGTAGHLRPYGHSRIIDPNGVVVADTGAAEGMVIAMTDILIDLTQSLDFNGDGIIDCADICLMIDHWGTDHPLYDIAPMPWGDGIVDVQDLIVLAEHLFEEFQPAEEINVNEENDGGQVELEQGQILVVTLESNPTTGYSWQQAENQPPILEQMGEAEFKPSETGEPPLVGAGGWEIFRFKAISAGQMTLKLIYRRPWEEGVEPVKTFTLDVIIH